MFGFVRLKDVNESINTLTDQLQLARGEAAKYWQAANMWKATARQISDDLEEAQARIAEQDVMIKGQAALMDVAAPLIAYANRVKASNAKYELKRGAK